MIYTSLTSPIYQRFNKVERYQYMNLEKEYIFIKTDTCATIKLCQYINGKKYTLSFYPTPKAIRTILSKRDIQE